MKKGLIMASADDGFGNSFGNGKSKWLLDIGDNGIKCINFSGPMPYAASFIASIIECPEVKEALKSFQKEDDNDFYKMVIHEGVSGCVDLMLKTAYRYKGFEVVGTSKILHISMYGKINDSFLQFSYRELIEIAKYLELLQTEARHQILEGEEVKYFDPEEIDDSFSKAATVILD